MAKRERRTKTNHTGVKLKQVTHRSGSSTWVARYIDPDTGSEKQESLAKQNATSEAARNKWARDKYEAIQKRLFEIAGGSPKRDGSTTFKDAIEAFQTARAPEVRDATVKSYKKVGPKLIAWAELRGIRRVQDLTLALIVDFRTWLLAQPKQVAAPGGKSGQKIATTETRAAAGLNSDLTTVRAMFNEWRRSGRVPLVSSDDIKDGLRRVGAERPRPAFLKAKAITELLKAALRHDADTGEEDAASNEGQSLTVAPKEDHKPGKPRFDPIAPFLAACLLSGCRVGELMSLPWSAVDLEAQGGRGEILILATATKTKIERAVDLGVSPGIKRLFERLKIRAAGAPYVFGGLEPLPRHAADNARKRLVSMYGAPKFSWKTLRQTTGTFLTNAPGIYGASSAYRSARQLGHSVVVAEKHYLGLVHVDADAKTLDDAMQINQELEQVLDRIMGIGTNVEPAASSA